MRKPAILAAAILCVGLPASAAAPPQHGSEEEPATPAPSADQELEELTEEYAAAVREFKQAYAEKSEEERGAFYAEHAPDPEAFAPRFMALAERHPGTDAAIGALAWVVRNSEEDESVDTALEVLAEYYLDSEVVSQICSELVWRFSDTTFLETALQHSPSVHVRGSACYALAQLHMNAAELIGMLSTDEVSREQVVAGMGEEAMAWLEDSEVSELRHTAEGYLVRVVEDFADVRGPRRTLGESAEGALFKLRNLSIGMVAPDIEGEDVDGVTFRLSDYRGKVVVLDFWGDW